MRVYVDQYRLSLNSGSFPKCKKETTVLTVVSIGYPHEPRTQAFSHSFFFAAVACFCHGCEKSFEGSRGRNNVRSSVNFRTYCYSDGAKLHVVGRRDRELV